MLHSSYDTRDFAAQNFYTTFASDTATEKVNTFWNHIKLKKSTGKNTDQLDAVFKKTYDRYAFNSGSAPNRNRSELYQLQYNHTYQTGNNVLWVYGAALEQRKIISNDRGDHRNNHAAIFGSAVLKHQSLTLNPGIRLVHDQNYGTEILPQMSLSYITGKLVLRAGAGRAIRSADFTERFNNYNKAFVRSGSIGNPNLMAERSWSYETGFDYSIKNVRVSVTGFIRDQQKLIDFVNAGFNDIPRNQNLDSNGRYAYAKNIKKVNTRGIEMEASFKKDISRKQSISIMASALLLDSKTSDSVPSFYILSHAKWLIQQTVMYRIGGFNISLTSVFKERTAQQATAINAVNGTQYWLVNGRAGYSYKQYGAFIMVNNIGDIRYSDLLGSLMPGRWASAGVSVSF